MEDRRVHVCGIAEAVDISIELMPNPYMKKLFARRVPRLLTIDQKRTLKDILMGAV